MDHVLLVLEIFTIPDDSLARLGLSRIANNSQGLRFLEGCRSCVAISVRLFVRTVLRLTTLICEGFASEWLVKTCEATPAWLLIQPSFGIVE